MRFYALFSGLVAVILAPRCDAALTTVADFGDNPTNLEMQIYLPDNLAEKPAVVVAVSPIYRSAQA